MRATALALRRPDLQTLLSELAGAHWPEVTEVRLAMVAPLLYRLRRFSAAHAADPDHPIAHARAGRLGGGRAAPTGRLHRAGAQRRSIVEHGDTWRALPGGFDASGVLVVLDAQYVLTNNGPDEPRAQVQRQSGATCGTSCC